MAISFTQGERSYRIAGYWLDVPEVGQWFASVRVNADSAPPTVGMVTLSDGQVSWVGYAREVRPDGAVMVVDVVGGRGHLLDKTTPTHWAGSVPTSLVLTSLCSEVGETSSPVVGNTLPTWRSKGASLALEVVRLAAWTSGGSWYTAADSTISVSEREWSDAAPPGALLTVEAGAVRYESQGLPQLVGFTVDGRRVGRALYVSGSASPYVDTWQSIARGGSGSRGVSGAKVDSQDGARVDVTLDDGSSVRDIPIWSSPGVRAVVTPGSRVLVVDLGDDPRGPFAMSGPWDAGAEELTLTASAVIAVDAPQVKLSGAFSYVLRSGDIMRVVNLDGSPLPGPLAPLSSLPLRIELHSSQDDPIPSGPPGAGHSAVKA